LALTEIKENVMRDLYDLIEILYKTVLMPGAEVFYIPLYPAKDPPFGIHKTGDRSKPLNLKAPGAFLGARYASDK
jgi:hypothetical protein